MRRTTNRLAVRTVSLAFVFASVLMVGGCGSNTPNATSVSQTPPGFSIPTSPQGESGAQGAVVTRRQVSLSRGDTPKSLTELAKSADVVAVVTVAPSEDRFSWGPLPVTRYSMKVDRILRGSLPTNAGLVMPGWWTGKEIVTVDGGPDLSKGGTYLVWLEQLGKPNQGGTLNSDFSPAFGAAGVFSSDGVLVNRIDDQSSALPERFDISDAEKAVQATS